MKILICNERFLFRFGADRVLLLLGQRLRALGHQVVLLGFRFDEESRATFDPNLITVPIGEADYIDLNEHTAGWLREHWRELFSTDPPDLAIVGGWPFYMALPLLREHCPVIAIDFGAVPLDGMSGSALMIQEKLRHLRSLYLEKASLIVAISRFVAETQSLPDSGGRVPVTQLLLGADHIDEAMWQQGQASRANGRSVAEAVAALRREGKRILLALGRWEPGCYKNSDVTFELLRLIRTRVPDCVLLVLAPPTDVAIPHDLKGVIIPVGFPSDAELAQLMGAVDIGVSVSLWEGFNLPLAEMQWLGRPALVFDLGAHPEVVADPWYLCADVNEMADKAVHLLSADAGTPAIPSHALATFRSHFCWERAFREFLGIVSQVVGVRALVRDTCVIMDVTNATRDPANTGVMRVTRRLAGTLEQLATPVFVVWDDHAAGYVFPTLEEYRQLSQFEGPVAVETLPRSSGKTRLPLADRLEALRKGGPCCFLLTETIPAARVRAAYQFGADQQIPVAAVFYDAIPVLHPELCPDELIRANHGAYMRELAGCDMVLPISGFSARCLKEYWDGFGLTGSQIVPLLLPEEFAAAPRAQRVDQDISPDVRILCVSTLEPRKNHEVLLAACRLLDDRFPGLAWSLSLVGNRYAGAEGIADMVEEVSCNDPRIAWLGVVSDAELAALYRQASFTMYPSLIEGFGVPILESLWFGKPCICRNEGVMAELASDGGCLTVDVTDPAALCDAIGRLATDHGLRHRLAEEAIHRTMRSWEAYGADLCMALLARCATLNTVAVGGSSRRGQDRFLDWTEVLYPGCLLTHWQQDQSERLAIAAVLTRHRPWCSIEVGTYHGGSLSLVQQCSQMVFSIDIDPAVVDRVPHFLNVSFLTGPSHAILPVLFRELDAARIPVEFILIDGDHSEQGVLQDIACILDYVPKAPLFVLLHDSFNPQCRQGMLGAPWARSPYVQWVDIDFVPGRLVENGGSFDGELWGGLAMAYLTPTPRRLEALTVRASAATMFHKLRQLQYRER